MRDSVMEISVVDVLILAGIQVYKSVARIYYPSWT